MSGNNKTESPLVSVIMPAFNHENYVQEAIKSIISQTYPNIELLIVNDGSTDSTWNKIQEMRAECENRFSRVVFETQENKGTCLTQNRLLDLCSKKSKYVYIIASDDIALPSAIEKELSFLEENPKYGLCVGDNAFMDDEGKIRYWDENQNIVYEPNKAVYKTFGEALECIRDFSFDSNRFGSYEELFKINHVPNGYLIRSKIFKKFRFSQKAPLEDWNLMLYIAKYYKFKFINEVLFRYRWHSNNSIKNTEKINNYEKTTKEHEEKILKSICVLSLQKDLRKYAFVYKSKFKRNFLHYVSYKIYKKIKTFKRILNGEGWWSVFFVLFGKFGITLTPKSLKVKSKLKHAWKKRKDFHIDPVAFGVSNEVLKKQKESKFVRNIKFSILVPLYNTPKEFLQEMIGSVLFQTYKNWELCLADGSDAEHSYVQEICERIAKDDIRIKYRKLEKNGGISANTNECLKMATGDYISLFDHDDLLHPSALFETMKAICEKDADFVYTDEAVFKSPNLHEITFTNFKPDFAPDYLHGNNYITHFVSFSKSLQSKVGFFDSECDGAQDYDMILRLTEVSQKIYHIKKCLYYWRSSPSSTASGASAKSYTTDAGKNALEKHFSRNGVACDVSNATAPNTYRISYPINGNPLVSILIPNYEHWLTLKKCIDSIFNVSTFKNIEVVIIENNSKDKKTFDYYERLSNSEYKEKIKIIKWEDKFNYSAINNFGFKYATGDYILLLNNDIEVITPNWIEEMLMFAQRKDVGAVGAMLYYPSNRIQHAGVIVGINGIAGHSHKSYMRESLGYAGRLGIVQNYSAVTAACMMVPRNVYEQMHGLDESFEVAFNDIDFCMRIRQAGYLIVWTPFAELYHYESESRGYEDTPEKKARFAGEIERFQTRWKNELEAGDPYYNPNLNIRIEDFSITGEVFPSEK